jgi:glycosyltransferase involved in cell wall biosynthesis
MRVALEATGSLAHRFTGLQRYILEVSRGLAELGAADLQCEVLLRIADFRKRKLKPNFSWPVRWYCSGPWPAMPFCDLVHGLGLRLPRTPHRIARVSTFFDLSPISLPRYGSERSWRKTLQRMEHAARTADRIIAISAATRTDFLHYFKYPEQNVVVTHLGVSPVFLSRAASPPSRDRRGTSRPYFVAFGGNPRKNLSRIITGFGLCSLRDSAELRVLGALDAQDREAVRRAGLEDRVLTVADVDEPGMADLYEGSLGLLYPSLLEGFGLPILEAMACRTPVLTSARACTEEIAGGHAILVEPEAPEDIAAGIDRLVSIRQEIIDSAIGYARSFTWKRTAAQTLAVYRSVAV